MKTLIKKWNGKGIQDDLIYTSEEFNSFARQFFNAVKREFPDDEVVNRSRGHYDLSCYVKRGDQFVYVSFSVPRGEYPLDMSRRDPIGGILIRRAKDEKDYTGASNHFTSFFSFREDVESLFNSRNPFKKRGEQYVCIN